MNEAKVQTDEVTFSGSCSRPANFNDFVVRLLLCAFVLSTV